MTLSRTILAAALAMTPVAAAHANELRPIEARGISLGNTSGTAYYTVERDGLRVIATFAEGEAGTPFRVEAVLAPGQSLFFSTPRAAGVAANSVELTRHGDTLLLQEEAVTN
jgi:hypothetical protein